DRYFAVHPHVTSKAAGKGAKRRPRQMPEVGEGHLRSVEIQYSVRRMDGNDEIRLKVVDMLYCAKGFWLTCWPGAGIAAGVFFVVFVPIRQRRGFPILGWKITVKVHAG